MTSLPQNSPRYNPEAASTTSDRNAEESTPPHSLSKEERKSVKQNLLNVFDVPSKTANMRVAFTTTSENEEKRVRNCDSVAAKAMRSFVDANERVAHLNQEYVRSDRLHIPKECRRFELEIFKAKLDVSERKLELQLVPCEVESESFDPEIQELMNVFYASLNNQLCSLRETRENRIREYEQELLERFPDHLIPYLKKMSWNDASNNLVNERLFRQVYLSEDAESQREALGPLYKPGAEWPIFSGEIRLCLASYDQIFPDQAGTGYQNEIGPVAQGLSRAASNTAFFCLNAGSGIRSALVDLGRKFFVIHIKVSSPENIPPLRPFDEEKDFLFISLHDYLIQKTHTEDTTGKTHENWRLAVHRSKVELVARLLQLVRLFREVGNNVTPWQFMVQQLGDRQDFVDRMIWELKRVDEPSLMQISKEAMTELQLHFGKHKLVVAIDDIHFGILSLTDRFLRPREHADDEDLTCILSPLCSAINDMSDLVGWNVVLAGNAVPEEWMRSLRRDLNKFQLKEIHEDPSNKARSSTSIFATASAKDVKHIISRLNISKKLQRLLSAGITKRPLAKPSCDEDAANEENGYLRDVEGDEIESVDSEHQQNQEMQFNGDQDETTNLDEGGETNLDGDNYEHESNPEKEGLWFESKRTADFLEEYFVDARMELLRTAIEYIPNVVYDVRREGRVVSADTILWKALQNTVIDYKNSLISLLKDRLTLNHLYASKDLQEVDEYVDFLRKVVVTMKSSNGSQRISVKASKAPLIGIDFTHLSIATDIFPGLEKDPAFSNLNKDEDMEYIVSERFVLDAITKVLRDLKALRKRGIPTFSCW